MLEAVCGSDVGGLKGACFCKLGLQCGFLFCKF